MGEDNKIKIAAYVYSAWHHSSYRKSLGPSWNEWNLLKSAKPLFFGHQIIEKPLWGYYDDTNPIFVENQIKTALKYGVNIFIFNYYWDKKPVLNEGIDQGFLWARNRQDIQFALMWSPRLPRITLPLPLNIQDDSDRIRREVRLTKNKLIQFIKFCMTEYFCKDNYLKIDGKPVIYFFQYYKFIELIGGARVMKQIFREIDVILQTKGFAGLYPIGTSDYINFTTNFTNAGFKALTSYNLLGNYQNGKAVQNYSTMIKRRVREWPTFLKKGGSPYLPSISLGFDASCRGEWKLSMPKRLDGSRYYPWYPIITNFKIKGFERLLKQAYKFLNTYKIMPRIIHIASWNEWSEGNHLEPGIKSGFRYLKTLKKFVRHTKKNIKALAGTKLK